MSGTVALLINMGSPDGPEVEPVRRFLGEFLMDPYVVDLPSVLRWALVHGVILRTRPAASAHAYRQIWTPAGSPLVATGEALARAVQERVSEIRVVSAMRYGNPGLRAVIGEALAGGASRLLLVPLYPQYAEATTRSAIECAMSAVGDADCEVRWIDPFHGDAAFLDAFAGVAREALTERPWDYLLMSFHGLPERQIRRADRECLRRDDCCSREGVACYRAQCFATAEGIASRLGVGRERYGVSFQSRLGRSEWLKPYTQLRYRELAASGVRHLAVMCPSFVADCLETLEEIGMRGREEFLKAGGESFTLVPSLNVTPAWVGAVEGMVRRGLGSGGK